MMLLSFGDETIADDRTRLPWHPKQWRKQWAIPRQALPSTAGHSVKPEIFLEMIESYYLTLPKIELIPAWAGAA